MNPNSFFPADYTRIKEDAVSHEDYESKHDIVTNYLNSLSSNFTEPNSKEWLHSRLSNEVDGKIHYCIGGSELASVIGQNVYQSRNELCAKKAHLITTGETEVDGSEEAMKMKWGHVVEPLLRRRCEVVFGTEFFDVPISIPHHTNKNFRYTPDGIGILRVKTKELAIADDVDNDELVIVVLELKNPQDRVVKGVIPEYYIPQIMSGMDTVTISEGGLFAEGNWKAKSYQNLCLSRYSGHIHYRGTLNSKTGSERYDNLEVLDDAVVVFYHKQFDPMKIRSSELADTDNMHDLWLTGIMEKLTTTNTQYFFFGNVRFPLMDIGSSSLITFISLLNLVEYYKDSIGYQHSTMRSECESDFKSYVAGEIGSMCARLNTEGKYPFAILPLSLYKEQYYYLSKNANYILHYDAQIKSFVADLDNLVKDGGGPFWLKPQSVIE